LSRFSHDADSAKTDWAVQTALLLAAAAAALLTLASVASGVFACAAVYAAACALALLGVRAFHQRQIVTARTASAGTILSLAAGLVIGLAELNGITVGILLVAVVFNSLLTGARGGWMTMLAALAAGLMVFLNGRYAWWEPLIVDDSLGTFIALAAQLAAAAWLVSRAAGSRQRVERELEAERGLLRTIIDTVPDLIFVRDTQGRYMRINEAMRKHAGQTQDTDILGKRFDDVFPKSIYSGQIDDELRRVLAGESLLGQIDLEIAPESGEETWYTKYKAPLRDSTGSITGMVGVVKITNEQTRVEQELRALLEAVPDTIIVYDRQGICQSVQVKNPADLIVPAEHMPGKSLDELLPAAVASEFRQRITATLSPSGVETNPYEFELDMPGGHSHFESRMVAVGSDRVMAIVRNITERKRAEAELHDSKERLTQALRAAQAGAWEWNMITNDVIWSEENFHVLGLDPATDRAGYDCWLSCVHPDDRDTASAQVAEVVEKRSELNIEFRVIWPDDSIHWVQDVGRMVFDAAGRPVSMYGIQMDITRRKRAEDEREALITQLEAKNAELERFSYTVSHDLKSPLITIRGFLGYVEAAARTGEIENLQQDIKRIESAADKMQRLLDELLELSRIGRVMRQAEAVPFAEIAREALALLQGALADKDVEVIVADDLPVVYGDRVRLLEVLQNLIENAVKFMGNQPRPRIEIGVRRDGGVDTLFVRDNGIGVEPRYLHRVFGLFEKLDANTQGTGVGLALVKRIVEIHGGRISAESDGLGTGTTFCFTLPAPPTRQDESEHA
jgi:PAS domain S-box-containing protein